MTMNTLKALVLICLLAAPATARAAADEALASAPPTAAPVDDAVPARASLPWQLRSVELGSGARVDGRAAAFDDAQGNLDLAVSTVVELRARLAPRWAATLRLGVVGNDAPGAALDGRSFVNPLVGATWARPLGPARLALFGGATLPLGTGAGDARYVAAAKTNAAARTVRPSDDAMFAVDDVAALVGADLAWTSHGFSAQAEATLTEYVRVRGAGGDSLRTSSAVGLHLGQRLGAHVSLGGDVLYQRWLANAATPNTLTVAAGPRLRFCLGKQGSISPGLAVVRGLGGRGYDLPVVTNRTTAVQLEVAVGF
jgi:hypothetical protein